MAPYTPVPHERTLALQEAASRRHHCWRRTSCGLAGLLVATLGLLCIVGLRRLHQRTPLGPPSHADSRLWGHSAPADDDDEYVKLGPGYCMGGAYASWDADDARDLATCQARCSAERQCAFVAFIEGKTCSRYRGDVPFGCAKRVGEETAHVTYQRRTRRHAFKDLLRRISHDEVANKSDKYTFLGPGFCFGGCYSGWSPADADSLEKCKARCSSEPGCVFISFKQYVSCSRYKGLVPYNCLRRQGQHGGIGAKHVTYRRTVDANDPEPDTGVSPAETSSSAAPIQTTVATQPPRPAPPPTTSTRTTTTTTTSSTRTQTVTATVVAVATTSKMAKTPSPSSVTATATSTTTTSSRFLPICNASQQQAPPPPTGPCALDFQAPPPPQSPQEHNGVALIEVCHAAPTKHVFVIGDWGGVFEGGRLQPADDRRPSTSKARLFVDGVDDKAQLLVADQMRQRALKVNPDYVLNVGDNFYWGGIEHVCGTGPTVPEAPVGQWQVVFENVYNGPGLDGKKWLGVLGNHDYGGYKFTAGWDEVIGYTWSGQSRGRWLTPAQYWSQRVKYDDFAIDYFFVDSNHHDALTPEADPEHNMCSRMHNDEVTSCDPDGPTSVDKCLQWFQDLWEAELCWLRDGLAKSTAEWQIVVTHFPPSFSIEAWGALAEEFGIDMFITGHVHSQGVYTNYGGQMQGTTVIVSGGGGGITSEASPVMGGEDDQYGFMDLTMSRTEIKIEAISHSGVLRSTNKVHPRKPAKAIGKAGPKTHPKKKRPEKTSPNVTLRK